MSTQPSPRSAHSVRRYVHFGTVVSVLNSLGTLWIIVLMIVINVDVIGRTAFRAPLPGVLELVTLSIVGIIFLQMGHTVRARRITRSDALFKAMMARWPRAVHGLQMLYHLGGAVLFVVLFYASFPFLIESWNSGEYEGVQGYVAYPVWPVRLIILVGSVCCAVQYLIFAWQNFAVMTGRRAPGEEAGDFAGVEVLR